MECKWHAIHENAVRKEDEEVQAEWVWSQEYTCVLDLADYRDATLEDVGEMFGVTRERVRQIEGKTLKRVKHHTRRKLLEDFKDMAGGKEKYDVKTISDRS